MQAVSTDLSWLGLIRVWEAVLYTRNKASNGPSGIVQKGHQYKQSASKIDETTKANVMVTVVTDWAGEDERTTLHYCFLWF